MSRLTRDEILDIQIKRHPAFDELIILPNIQPSFIVYDNNVDYMYYYGIYIGHFYNPINSVNGVSALPSGSSQLPIPASNLPNTTSRNIAISNGFNWGQIYIPGFDSEDTSPEFKKEIPAWLKITKCDCGVWTTYGKDYPADKHSDWCDIYKEEMKIQAINKISSDDVPF